MKKHTVFYRSTPDTRGETELKDVEIEGHSAFGAVMDVRKHRSDVDYVVGVR